MQTLIRVNLAILLSLVTLAVFAFFAFVGLSFYEAKHTSRFLAETKCSTMLADLKTQNVDKATMYGEAFQSTSVRAMKDVDQELYVNSTTFANLLRMCFKQPDNTLRDILVKTSGNAIAANVIDLYNTIDSEVSPSAPMAQELYVQPQTVSDTQPQTEELKAPEVKGTDAGTPFPAEPKTKAAQPNAK